jgi:hypothetical protein
MASDLIVQRINTLGDSRCGELISLEAQSCEAIRDMDIWIYMDITRP